MAFEGSSISDTVAKGIGKGAREAFGISGYYSIDHIRDGQVIDHLEGHNMITDAGKAIISGLMLADVGGSAFDYIAIGIGNTAASHTDTALGSEITTYGGARRGVVGTQTTTTYTNDTAQLVTTFTFTSGAAFAVTEAGVFNAASGVTLLCRQVFAAVNVVAGDTLQVTWKVQVSAAIV